MSQFILKNKIKLIVLFCFVSGALIGSTIDLDKWFYGYDRSYYIESCDLIIKNEKESNDIIEQISNGDEDYALSELENAKALLIENIRLYNNLLLIDKLERRLRLKCLTLKKYTGSKLSYYSFLKKRIQSEDPQSYDNKIEEIRKEIYRLLDGKDPYPLK